MFCAWIVTLDWYLFKLIVLLKPDINSCNSFALSWIAKVTNGTQSFVSLIAHFVTTVATEITQSAGQANMTLISKSTQEFYITYLST